MLAAKRKRRLLIMIESPQAPCVRCVARLAIGPEGSFVNVVFYVAFKTIF